MAASARTVWKAVSRCQRQFLSGSVSTIPTNFTSQIKTVAATKEWKKPKKETAAPAPKVKKERVVVDDTGRHKPYGKTAWASLDDVYILRYYPRTIYNAADAVQLLKNFQLLDFTPHVQPVYVNLKLDMKLEKKKKIDQFVSTVHLPHPFNVGLNKVLVFTEDPTQAQVAREGGATFVGGEELIQQILDDKIEADFYISVPEMLQKITPLKNKLRKKFPKSKRGSVGVNIPKMLSLFRMGHEYIVEGDCYVKTQVATLDFPTEHIIANLKTVLADVCTHRPADMGPFIERAMLCSQTSEALWFNSKELLSTIDQENKE
ncbi:large ribosomal subunit protein uL1m [Stigmatopora nigra]